MVEESTATAHPAPRMRHSCSLPFPAVEVGQRLQRQLVLLDIDQQPTSGRLVAAVDNWALQYQTAWRNYLDGVGFLARKGDLAPQIVEKMSLYDCNDVRANFDVSSPVQMIQCRD